MKPPHGMAVIQRNPNAIYTALVPNVRGAERAIECQLDEVNLVMSASETHNQTNMRINVSLSTVFGCPMEGDVDEAVVFDLIGHFVDQGIDSMTLCDTIGMAYPTQVHAIAKRAIENYPSIDVVMHFHNTRGMALANVMASLDVGICWFDSSLGGIGGCPYAPGASGDVCTEELVHMLDLMGYSSGVDIYKLLDLAKEIPALIGHEVPSQLIKAGLRSQLHAMP